MNVFLAGIHGVGKSYLASHSRGLDVTHLSASQLIKDERAHASWGIEKHVAEIDENQVALTCAVERYNASGHRLLLDGHFVLLDVEGNIVPLETSVFKSLKLDGVLLVEVAVNIVVEHVATRDGRHITAEETKTLMAAEHAQAEKVSASLGIPLIVLSSPSVDDFTAALSRLLR